MHQRQQRPVTSVRLVGGVFVAFALAATLTTATGWSPLCVLYDMWDPLWYFHACWDGPPADPRT